MTAAFELSPSVGRAAACRALEIPRASFYRVLAPQPEPTAAPVRPTPARALTETERQTVLTYLRSERFMDQAPHQVHAALLDEGIYVCSPRTMCRLLEDCGEVRERRDQLRHPTYQKPELLATRPNQVWSWDITKLRGPVKWTYFYLYVILDLFIRYVAGWMSESTVVLDYENTPKVMDSKISRGRSATQKLTELLPGKHTLRIGSRAEWTGTVVVKAGTK